MARVIGVTVKPPTKSSNRSTWRVDHGPRRQSRARQSRGARKSSRQNGRRPERRCPDRLARPVGEPAGAVSTAVRPAQHAMHGGRLRAVGVGRAVSAPRRRSPREARRPVARRSRRESIEDPRIPPVSRRSVGTSSATWRRQNPCFRSRSARNPRSRTRSLMIASIVAFSERARTAQIGQPPRRIASSRRTSTMSACQRFGGAGRPVAHAGRPAASRTAPRSGSASGSSPEP